MSTRTVTNLVRRCGAGLLCFLVGLAARALAAVPDAVEAPEHLVIARTEYRIEAVPGEVTWTAATRLDISGPGLERLTAAVPPDLQIIRVAGDGLGSWKSEISRGRRPKQTLELYFDESLSGERAIVLTGVLTHAPDQPWPVPPLILHGVDAHTGRARLVSAGTCDLTLEDLDGARAVIDDSGTPGFVFDLWRENFRLEFITRERDHSIRATLLTRLTPAGDRIGLTAVAELQPLRAPLFELQLAIPSGWQVSRVRINERSVPWHSLAERDGVRDLRIPLSKAMGPGCTVPLELRASQVLPEAVPPSREVPLPEVRLPQASRVRGRYVIDESRASKTELADLSGLRTVAEHEFGDALCYEHDTQPIAGTLRITPRPVAAPPAQEAAAPGEAIAADDVESLPVPATIARHVRIVSTLDASGRARHRAEYAVPSELSCLLVRLPSSATPWRALAGNKPLRMRRHGEAVELHLPRPDIDETERAISIVYCGKHASLDASGSLQLEPLAIRAVDQSGRESDLQALEQHWSIEPPGGVVVYESRGAYRPVHPLASTGWLAGCVQALSSPAGTVWAGLILAAAFAIARLRTPQKLRRTVATAALVIAAATLVASARPLPGGAPPSQPADRMAKSASEGTLFRAILPADAPLSIRYATRVHSVTARCAAAACALFVLWLLRRRGPSFHALLAAAGLAGPVAALPLVEAAQHVWLDGIALGTLAAVLLRQILPSTVPFKASAAPKRSAATLMILAMTAGSAHGDEPPPAVRAESTFTVHMEDEGVHLQGRYDLRALSGSLDEFSFALPENVKVRAVSGSHVAGWEIRREEEPASLVVRFDAAASKTADLWVELFEPMSLPEGTATWDLPAFHPLNLTSHCGSVSVRAADHLTVTVADTRGLRRIDAAACREAEPSLAWALTGDNVALTLEITRPSRQCDVLGVHSAVVDSERLRVSTRFRVTQHGAPRLRFTAFVPEGYRPADVRAPNLARWSFDEGLLTVWLDRPQAGTADVELDLAAPLQPEAPGVEIAVPLPLDAGRVRSLLGVRVDKSLEPAVDADALTGWISAHGYAACDQLTDCEDDPPLLLLANDSPEPLPVVVALARRGTADAADGEAIAHEAAADLQPPLEEATPGALVETARLSVAIQEDGDCRIEAHYHVRNRAQRLLPIALPAGMRLLACDIDGRPATPVQPADEGSASVLVPLGASAGAPAEVKLLLEARLPAALPAKSGFWDRHRMDLPVPQIPTAEADARHGLPVVRTIWEVSVPSMFRATAASGETRAGRLIVEQNGSPASLRLSIAPASAGGPASLIAAAVLAAGIWSIARRRPTVPVTPPAPEPSVSSPIAALPHESGIFSATRRAMGRIRQSRINSR